MSAETVSETTEERTIPATVQGIHDAAEEVRALRRQGMSWAEVRKQTGFTRVDAMRLVHNLFELTDAVQRSQEPEGVMLGGIYTRPKAA